MTEANRHTYLNGDLFLTSLAWKKWAEGIGWVTCEGLSRLGFHIFRNLKNSRTGWEVPQERQGDSGQGGEEHLPERVMWRGPHGTPLRLVLTSRVLFYCRFPLPLWKASREDEKCLHLHRGLIKGGSGSVGPLSSCPCVVPLTPCGLVLLSPVQAPTSRGTQLPVKRGGKAATGFYSLFQPVTLWSWGISNSEQPGHFPNA